MTRSESAHMRQPSRRVLAALPERVVRFLFIAATHAGVRAALAEGGFGAADHAEGARLLAAVFAWSEEGTDPTQRVSAREAFDELAEWLAVHRARLEIAVERVCPSELGLFAGLPTAPGAAPVAVGALLARLSDLEARAARDPSAAHALETVSARGLTEAERARLAVIVEHAQQAPAPDQDGPIRDPREAELLALYAWFRDWAHTAKALIGRKDYLVALGLADRRRSKLGQGGPADGDPWAGEP